MLNLQYYLFNMFLIKLVLKIIIIKQLYQKKKSNMIKQKTILNISNILLPDTRFNPNRLETKQDCDNVFQ